MKIITIVDIENEVIVVQYMSNDKKEIDFIVDSTKHETDTELDFDWYSDEEEYKYCYKVFITEF